MSYVLMTDSSANLPQSIAEQYGIHIIPLVYTMNGKEVLSYTPGQPSDMSKFYNDLRSKITVTTSCVSVDSFLKVFTESLEKGEDILFMSLSSALSGTYQCSCIAAEELREKFPQRTILCLDSLSASLGQGLLMLYAARKKEAGEDIQSVYQWLFDNRLHLCHWFTVDDLFFLKRGGRVSSAAAVLGSLLDIKPVLHMDDAGRLIPVSKVRGRKNSLNELVRHMEESIVQPKGQTICISHGDCLEDAEYVADLVRKKFGIEEIIIDFVEQVVGAHSGPGTLALFFLGDKR